MTDIEACYAEIASLRAQLARSEATRAHLLQRIADLERAEKFNESVRLSYWSRLEGVRKALLGGA